MKNALRILVALIALTLGAVGFAASPASAGHSPVQRTQYFPGGGGCTYWGSSYQSGRNITYNGSFMNCTYPANGSYSMSPSMCTWASYGPGTGTHVGGNGEASCTTAWYHRASGGITKSFPCIPGMFYTMHYWLTNPYMYGTDNSFNQTSEMIACY